MTLANAAANQAMINAAVFLQIFSVSLILYRATRRIAECAVDASLMKNAATKNYMDAAMILAAGLGL